jgi:hypothetical protein
VASTFQTLKPLPDSVFAIIQKYMSPRTSSRLRKLSIKADKESKSRVFAILDY